MKILMTCGGTGGHINPAIAVADKLKEMFPDAQISFVGAQNGMEANLVPKAGYDIEFVKVKGFKRKLTLENIKAAYFAFTSVFSAKKIVKRIKPDIVIGTGGYASWPAMKAASQMHIPTLIQEQNAFPGVTQRKLSKYADKICVSFAESIKFFDESVRDKIIVTGNPVKPCGISRKEAREKLGISDDELYIVSGGGSLGARKINELVFELIDKYTGPKGIKHIHSVGKLGYEKFSNIAKERHFDKYKNVTISDYIYDMPLRLAAADVVIGRAGAMTLAENALAGKATLLVPSPNVTDDHQYKNAKVLADAGAAVVFRESEVTDEKFINAFARLCEDTEYRRMTENNIKRFAMPDAVGMIANAAAELLKK